MGDELCLKDTTFIPGGTLTYSVKKSGRTMRAKVADLCADARAVTHEQYDQFIRETQPKDAEDIISLRPKFDEKPTARVTGADIEIGEKYCKALGKRLPTPPETQFIMKSNKVSFVNEPIARTGGAFSWVTLWKQPTQYRVGKRSPKAATFDWVVTTRDTMAYDASLFCVATPKKK